MISNFDDINAKEDSEENSQSLDSEAYKLNDNTRESRKRYLVDENDPGFNKSNFIPNPLSLQRLEVDSGEPSTSSVEYSNTNIISSILNDLIDIVISKSVNSSNLPMDKNISDNIAYFAPHDAIGIDVDQVDFDLALVEQEYTASNDLNTVQMKSSYDESQKSPSQSDSDTHESRDEFDGDFVDVPKVLNNRENSLKKLRIKGSRYQVVESADRSRSGKIKSVNGYEVVSELGRGAYGIVYKVEKGTPEGTTKT